MGLKKHFLRCSGEYVFTPYYRNLGIYATSPVMASVNPTAPVDFVSASTNNDTVQHQPIVLPSSPQEDNKKELKGEMAKTVEGELDIPPLQGWFPPISRPT